VSARAQMVTRIPTRIGDVLILTTDKTFSTYAVGQISKDGQQDFRGQTNVKFVSGRAAAVAEAKALVAPGRRILFRSIDNIGDWSEISR
jgi:hypothetical protein